VSVFYTWHELESTLVCYRYDGVSGTIGDTIQRLSFPAASLHALALHPSGRMLYTSQGNRNGLRTWHVDARDGRLTPSRVVLLGEATPTHITATPDGESIFILDGLRGSIYKVTADRMTGELHCKAEVAVVNEPKSIALKTI
jgi:6-phosphogluconolactonase (cycloisomerase 2 family)